MHSIFALLMIVVFSAVFFYLTDVTEFGWITYMGPGSIGWTSLASTNIVWSILYFLVVLTAYTVRAVNKQNKRLSKSSEASLKERTPGSQANSRLRSRGSNSRWSSIRLSRSATAIPVPEKGKGSEHNGDSACHPGRNDGSEHSDPESTRASGEPQPSGAPSDKASVSYTHLTLPTTPYV